MQKTKGYYKFILVLKFVDLQFIHVIKLKVINAAKCWFFMLPNQTCMYISLYKVNLMIIFKLTLNCILSTSLNTP